MTQTVLRTPIQLLVLKKAIFVHILLCFILQLKVSLAKSQVMVEDKKQK
jgi:hypothetical protein